MINFDILMNNQCAKFLFNVILISVFKLMLKILNKLHFFTCCISFLGEYMSVKYCVLQNNGRTTFLT